MFQIPPAVIFLMPIITEQEIPVCTLDRLSILRRLLPGGGEEYSVIMMFTDETQRPDPWTDEGYQTLAGPFRSLPRAEEIKQKLKEQIEEMGLNSVVNKVIAGEPIGR